MELHQKEDKESIQMEQFGGVLYSHMQTQMGVQLENAVAQAVQNAANTFFKRVQNNNRVGETDIFLNKHVTQFCFQPGIKAFGIEMEGNFFRKKEDIDKSAEQKKLKPSIDLRAEVIR